MGSTIMVDGAKVTRSHTKSGNSVIRVIGRCVPSHTTAKGCTMDRKQKIVVLLLASFLLSLAFSPSLFAAERVVRLKVPRCV